MSFYSDQIEQMIDSNTPDLQLHTITNLAATPQVNVIVVHGLAEYAKRFDPLASYLCKHDCNVFRYDQLGHGQTEGERGFLKSPADLYENLRIVVQAVQTKYPDLPLFMVGHSMGGETVLLYGCHYPQTVDGLIVTDPVSLAKGPSSINADLPGDDHDQIPNAINGGLDCDHRVVDKYVHNPAVLHQLTVGIMRHGITDGAMYLREHLSDITDPILYLQGLQDGLINYHDSLDAYAMISSEDKELHVYPFLMHEILNETSRKWEIYDEIIRWINKRRY